MPDDDRPEGRPGQVVLEDGVTVFRGYAPGEVTFEEPGAPAYQPGGPMPNLFQAYAGEAPVPVLSPPTAAPVPTAAPAAVPVTAPTPAAPRAAPASEGTVVEETATPEPDKKTVRRDDVEYSDPSQHPSVQQDRGELLEQLVPAELEAARRAEALQREYASQLQDNAARILDTMEETRRRTEEAQEVMRVRADALFSREFHPRSIYNSADSAANVGIRLGVAVGAMLQHFNNTQNPGTNMPNTALQMVQQAQEADIARQREMFRRGQLGLEADNAAMTAMRELGVDEVTAFEFARQQATENLATQLEALSAAHAGTRLGAALQDQVLQLRQQSMDRRLGIEMQMAQIAARAARRRGGQRRPTYGVQFGDDRDTTLLPDGFDFAVTDHLPTQRRQMAYANSPTIQRQTLEAVNGLSNFRRIMRRIDTFVVRGRGGGLTILPESRAQLASAAAEAALQLKSAYAMGALGSDVLDITDRLIGNPDSIFSDTSATLLTMRRMGRSADEQQQVHLRTHGLVGRTEFEDIATADEVVQNRVSHRDSDEETSNIRHERGASGPSDEAQEATEETFGNILGGLTL